MLKWLAILTFATMALGNFLVKSPFWGYGDQMVKTYKSLITVCAFGVAFALVRLSVTLSQPQKVFTPDQLAAYDGTDASKPLYVGIDGDVYDVSASRRIYGPLGPYNAL